MIHIARMSQLRWKSEFAPLWCLVLKVALRWITTTVTAANVKEFSKLKFDFSGIAWLQERSNSKGKLLHKILHIDSITKKIEYMHVYCTFERRKIEMMWHVDYDSVQEWVVLCIFCVDDIIFSIYKYYKSSLNSDDLSKIYNLQTHIFHLYMAFIRILQQFFFHQYSL